MQPVQLAPIQTQFQNALLEHGLEAKQLPLQTHVGLVQRATTAQRDVPSRYLAQLASIVTRQTEFLSMIALTLMQTSFNLGLVTLEAQRQFSVLTEAFVQRVPLHLTRLSVLMGLMPRLLLYQARDLAHNAPQAMRAQVEQASMVSLL